MDDETLFARVERGDVEAFTVVYKSIISCFMYWLIAT